MKKHVWICLLLACLLLLAACGGNNAAPETTKEPISTAKPDGPKNTDGPGPEDWSSLSGKGKVGTVLPDFSVETSDGTVFTLSDVLREKELVLINLWATWCPPCNTEFPYLETAYETEKDRVAVIALSIEETDTLPVLQAFAKEKGLSFPLGRDVDYALYKTFNVTAIPTSLLVDRSRTVIWMETGAMSSADAILKLFHTYLKDGNQDGNNAEYTVLIQDDAGNPVAGCVVNFCTEEVCVPVISDEHGKAVFSGEPYAYRVQLLSVPEEYDYTGSDMIFVRAEGDEISLTVTKLN